MFLLRVALLLNHCVPIMDSAWSLHYIFIFIQHFRIENFTINLGRDFKDWLDLFILVQMNCRLWNHPVRVETPTRLLPPSTQEPPSVEPTGAPPFYPGTGSTYSCKYNFTQKILID